LAVAPSAPQTTAIDCGQRQGSAVKAVGQTGQLNDRVTDPHDRQRPLRTLALIRSAQLAEALERRLTPIGADLDVARDGHRHVPFEHGGEAAVGVGDSGSVAL
jgi:hypothetical protein